MALAKEALTLVPHSLLDKGREVVRREIEIHQVEADKRLASSLAPHEDYFQKVRDHLRDVNVVSKVAFAAGTVFTAASFFADREPERRNLKLAAAGSFLVGALAKGEIVLEKFQSGNVKKGESKARAIFQQ